MKWWKYILIGIFYFIFHFIIYQDIIGGGLIDEHDAWSPLAEPLGALCSIAGVILIVVGIIGYFFPGFLKWPNFVFENWDKLWHIFKVVVFIVYQMILLLVICYAFIYEEITEKASGFFPLVIVLAVPVVIHWVFIYFKPDKFDDIYIKALDDIKTLVGPS